MYDKTKYIYVGLELHKKQHTVVIMDCFNEKLGEIVFQNKLSELGKFVLRYRKSVPQYKRNDSYDAQCVVRAAINELNKLPDAMPEDIYWTLSRLANRRANLKTHYICLKTNCMSRSV